MPDVSGWKSTAVFQRVKFEPVKSADPPINSGNASAMELSTVSLSLRVAMGTSVGLYVGKSEVKELGNCLLMRRVNWAALGKMVKSEQII